MSTYECRKGANTVVPASAPYRPRTFILQEPMRRDPVTKQLTSAMNFDKAAEYGDPVICLPPGPMALSPYPTKERLKECFKDFRDEDYIIAVGDPSLIFLAAMVICDINRGRCKMLKYDRDNHKYILVEFDIHRRLGQAE